MISVGHLPILAAGDCSLVGLFDIDLFLFVVLCFVVAVR